MNFLKKTWECTTGVSSFIKRESWNKLTFRGKLYKQLKKDEGVVYEIYNDHLGYPTFGVGHLVTERDPEYGLPEGTPVSKKRVFEAFEQDIDVTISECKFLYGDYNWSKFPSPVKQILANMMFNLGRPRLARFFRMNKAIEQGDWKTAAAEGRDSLWYNQVTNRAERLMSRLEKVV